MVRTNSLSIKASNFVREAFTMIELIYAIVVIAVVTLTIPMMIQVNNKGLEGNVAGEAIFLISSVLSEATTLVWDNRSIPGGAGATTIVLSKILDVPAGNAAYTRPGGNATIRIGGLDQDLHRQFFAVVTTPLEATGINNVGNSFDSTATGEQFGLKNSYDIKVTRTYVADAPGAFVFSTVPSAVQTNVKMTEVEVKADLDGDGTKEIISVLRAYTCNIGEIDFAKRRF